jgi:hypothetical protein
MPWLVRAVADWADASPGKSASPPSLDCLFAEFGKLFKRHMPDCTFVIRVGASSS